MSLTINEAITRFEQNAEQNERWANAGLNPEANAEYAAEHRQLAAWLRELQRARVLLKATHDLLEAADDSPYVEDVLGILVHYDGADCEGRCLMEDIEYHFDEFGEERRADADD